VLSKRKTIDFTKTYRATGEPHRCIGVASEAQFRHPDRAIVPLVFHRPHAAPTIVLNLGIEEFFVFVIYFVN